MLIKRLVVGALQANCYVVVDEESATAAVIDPGDDVPNISRIIVDSGVKLTHILLTHAHPDHSFAAGSLQEEFPDAALMLHRLEQDQLSREILEMVAQFYDMSTYLPCKPTDYLEDGQVISIGASQLKVIHTPGHTPGGVCFLNDKTLFSGDTLFAGGIGRTDFPGGSYDQLMDSIHNKLLVLSDDTDVYPGHGPETTIGRERKHNPWINSVL